MKTWAVTVVMEIEYEAVLYVQAPDDMAEGEVERLVNEEDLDELMDCVGFDEKEQRKFVGYAEETEDKADYAIIDHNGSLVLSELREQP